MFVVMVGLLLSAPAAAQSIDFSKGGPVEVTAADGMEWRQNERLVIARGAARARRGTSAAGTPIVRPWSSSARAPSGVATSAATSSPSAAVAASAATSVAA